MSLFDDLVLRVPMAVRCGANSSRMALSARLDEITSLKTLRARPPFAPPIRLAYLHGWQQGPVEQ